MCLSSKPAPAAAPATVVAPSRAAAPVERTNKKTAKPKLKAKAAATNNSKPSLRVKLSSSLPTATGVNTY